MLTPPAAAPVQTDPLTAFARPALRYRALADPQRLLILQLLAGGAHSVGQVAEVMGLPLPAASRHLTLLEDAGFIRRQRFGAWVDCRLTAEAAACVAALLTSSALGPDPRGDAALRDPTDLRSLDAEEVEVLLFVAEGALTANRGSHSEWVPQMIRMLGDVVEPQLPVLWLAAQRLQRHEPLAGLPLPDAVINRPRGEEEPDDANVGSIWDLLADEDAAASD